jgi:hypothetical protein
MEGAQLIVTTRSGQAWTIWRGKLGGCKRRERIEKAGKWRKDVGIRTLVNHNWNKEKPQKETCWQYENQN